jgi:hypothetical protein
MKFAVPNTFVVRISKGAEMVCTGVSTKASNILARKEFMIKPRIPASDSWAIYGVVYKGHFSGGQFSSSGKKCDIGPKHITDNVGHKIAYFAGFGCESQTGAWEEVVEKENIHTLWLTNYSFQPPLFLNLGLDALPIRTPEAIYKDKGNAGPSLRKWLKRVVSR